ncbi:Bifunctional protein FolD [Geodia barretti]|uniref:Bifunctional protein FolD n=1 Tax=Geodia barretti TaxID=519541 RepID=A0AA35QSW7_GEOBA|nr:Bifunctional protein FolD [Geodia barretti]
MSAKILSGTDLSAEIRSEVATGVVEMQEKHGVTPGLAVILVGGDPASAVYVNNKQRACEQAGLFSDSAQLPDTATEDEILAAVHAFNEDPRVHGILVQLPLPGGIEQHRIIESIDPDKDVDGIHPYNLGKLMQGRPDFPPCTPAGIVELLVRNGHDPEGANVVICGRSDIVGKPLAALLMQRGRGGNATVTVCHTRTRDLADVTREADILVAAIGRPEAITADMVRDAAVVIDVGINRVDDPSARRGYRLKGDVDYEAVSQKALAITPVPGGVGPMTIAMLLVNTLTAARIRIHGRHHSG